MDGARSLIQTLAGAGLDLCLANPGTTEMPLVAALDEVPGVRAVLGLFEGVCTGAADGFARVTGRPAFTLLHLGPGLANGLANLHNARRARSPIVNLVGDHATWHRAADAPLTSDVEGLARPVSGFVRTASSAEKLASEGAVALRAALGPPGAVATLVVPADCQWEEAHGPVPVLVGELPGPTAPDPDALAAARRALARAGPRAALLLGGDALTSTGLAAASRIAAATGCRAFVETFPSRMERGQGIAEVPKLPYFPEQAAQALAGCAELVLVGAADPVAFFGYPGGRSHLAPEACIRHRASEPGQDAVAALEQLAEELGGRDAPCEPPRAAPALRGGPLDPEVLGSVVAALQPEDAIVVDEAATSGLAWALQAASARPHQVLGLTGGAIGQGLPCAVGAALGAPGRRVLALQADGSGLYTLQALWTLAREALDVTVLVCANRAYRILQVELARAGVAEPGAKARGLTQLTPPPPDWVALARGFGVSGRRVETGEELAEALGAAFAEPGPTLIEALL